MMCVIADAEMAGRHRARFRSIQIIRTGVVAAKDAKRAHTMQYHVRFSCPTFNPLNRVWVDSPFTSTLCSDYDGVLTCLCLVCKFGAAELVHQVPAAPPHRAPRHQGRAWHLQGRAPQHLLQVSDTYFKQAIGEGHRARRAAGVRGLHRASLHGLTERAGWHSAALRKGKRGRVTAFDAVLTEAWEGGWALGPPAG